MQGTRARIVGACLALGCAFPAGCSAQEAGSAGGPEWVEGIRVGHFTLAERPTGCTVLLAPEGAVGGVDVRGGAPGTREIALLDPVNTVDVVHAVVLSGGSAFGLAASTGVVRYLEEQGIGYQAGPHTVPIVTSAILFDLGVGDDPSIRPDADCGYQAASVALSERPASGSVGAGAGATVGKMRGLERATKGGVGSASITLRSGLTIAAVVAVNAVGDVVDPATGQVVAGVRTEDGTGFADARALLRADEIPETPGQNTTIGAVVTNASLTKAQATKVAQMAQDGLARAIYPAHTPSDGDAIFTLATGVHADDVSIATLGALAAEVVAEAILDAVLTAESRGGIPSQSELSPRN